MHHAVRKLRLPELEQDYESAWNEWEASSDYAAWETTMADGIVDAARRDPLG